MSAPAITTPTREQRAAATTAATDFWHALEAFYDGTPPYDITVPRSAFDALATALLPVAQDDDLSGVQSAGAALFDAIEFELKRFAGVLFGPGPFVSPTVVLYEAVGQALTAFTGWADIAAAEVEVAAAKDLLAEARGLLDTAQSNGDVRAAGQLHNSIDFTLTPRWTAARLALLDLKVDRANGGLRVLKESVHQALAEVSSARDVLADAQRVVVNAERQLTSAASRVGVPQKAAAAALTRLEQAQLIRNFAAETAGAQAAATAAEMNSAATLAARVADFGANPAPALTA